MRQLLLKVLGQPIPLRVVAARKLIKHFSLFSYPERLDIGAVERPHYGHCIYEAAKLAARLIPIRAASASLGIPRRARL